jgi:hypothetical protein
MFDFVLVFGHQVEYFFSCRRFGKAFEHFIDARIRSYHCRVAEFDHIVLGKILFHQHKADFVSRDFGVKFVFATFCLVAFDVAVRENDRVIVGERLAVSDIKRLETELRYSSFFAAAD